MTTRHFFLLLISIIYMTLSFTAFADDNINDSESFIGRIITLQDETRSICSHIGKISLVAAKRFKMLMRNAHIYCPDNKGMETTLVNVETMANKYYSFVTEQLNGCQELSNMLTTGPENGVLVVYYLKEGNYSLVTSIIDKWYESFMKFRTTFYLTDTPLEIILENDKILYYDSWTESLAKSILKLAGLLTFSIVLSAMLNGIGLPFIIVTSLNFLTTSFRRKQSSINGHPWRKKNRQDNSANPGLRKRKINQGQQCSSDEDNIVCPASDAPESKMNTDTAAPTISASTRIGIIVDNSANLGLRKRKMNQGQQCSSDEDNVACPASDAPESKMNTDTVAPTILASTRIGTVVTCTLWFIIFCVLIAATLVWYPTFISLSKPGRHNWYHNATATLRTMLGHRDDLQYNLSHQIISIEELQRHASMYHDKTIQANVDEFVRTLATGIRQVSKESPDAYLLSERMPSIFRRTYERIEAGAKKVGRLSKANDLLVALNQISNKYEALQRFLQASVIHQRELLSILIKQTRFIQTLVQEGHLVEIGRIIKHHQDTLINIDKNIYQVQIEVKQIIEIVSNELTDAMKQAIESMKDETFIDKIKVMLGLGAVINFDKYNDALRYNKELKALETERANLKVAMEQLDKAAADQQEALKSSQASLSKIAVHSSQYSKIPGFTLNKIQRTAINDELLYVIAQYNRMTEFYDLFTKNMVNNRPALPPA